ncbi:MAG: hypothetical protein ACO2ZZ_13530, partial [Cyclobacteriaceae bacterium]
MKTTQEILLVYATDDDQPIEGLAQGWVTNFHKFLQNLLSQLQREESIVSLVSASALTSEQVDHASMLIAVITPKLAADQKAIELMSSWISHQVKGGTLLDDGVSRFMKIRKKDFDVDAVFPTVNNVVSYDLFFYDGLSGKTSEYTRFFGAEPERGFWMK